LGRYVQSWAQHGVRSVRTGAAGPAGSSLRRRGGSRMAPLRRSRVRSEPLLRQGRLVRSTQQFRYFVPTTADGMSTENTSPSLETRVMCTGTSNPLGLSPRQLAQRFGLGVRRTTPAPFRRLFRQRTAVGAMVTIAGTTCNTRLLHGGRISATRIRWLSPPRYERGTVYLRTGAGGTDWM